ncbi:hypothetical protein E4U44_008476, partial [Claviceps purpurea]
LRQLETTERSPSATSCDNLRLPNDHHRLLQLETAERPPNDHHGHAFKHLFRYLESTATQKLRYDPEGPCEDSVLGEPHAVWRTGIEDTTV